MSRFFKRTIKCEACGKPTQTIFVCASCFAKIPESDRKNFRRNYMKGHDTSFPRQTMLARLRKTSGRVTAPGVLIAIAVAIAVSAVLLAVTRIPRVRKPVALQPAPAPAVQWLGHPVMAQEGGTGHLTNVQFGIREDGVVIWRDIRGPSVGGKRFGDFPMPAEPTAFTPAAPFTRR